ncbi:MAG TPA: hypothetical protein VJU83_09340 [Burkholderiales bacterium]|nr:hypothetical protein [Burkholderiales bacterium]
MAALSFLMLVGLTAAGYVHLHATDFISTRGRLLTTRIILLLVGLGFGYVSATIYSSSALPSFHWLAFFTGFGAVHIPPAIILLIKRSRHSPKS